MIFAKWMSIKILLQVQVKVSLSVIVDVDKVTGWNPHSPRTRTAAAHTYATYARSQITRRHLEYTYSTADTTLSGPFLSTQENYFCSSTNKLP